jgi:hypothetical protein
LLAGVFALGASAARKPAVPGPSIHYGPVLLYVSNVAAKEGTTAAMQLKLQWMMPMDVEVYWKTVPATATAPRDYLHQSGEAVIKQGKLTTDCLISSVNDTMYEPNRTFKVELWSDNPLVKIVGSPASYTIQDDDPVPAVSIHDQPAPAVYEGGSLTWTVELANPSAYTITVPLDYNYPVDTTVIPADYTGTLPSSVTFTSGETVKTITIQSVNDGLTEPTEAIWIHLMPPIGVATLPAVDYTWAHDQTDRWGVGWISDQPVQP